MNLYIPENIRKIIGSRPYSLDAIGMSDSQVICFDDMVLKIEKQGEESDNEHRIMFWLADKLSVPKILCSYKEDGINYLLMSRIMGEMSCSPKLLENPKELVRLLAKGLKMLWSVDISDCPHSNSIENKLKLAEFRVQSNLCGMEDAEPKTYGKKGFESPAKLLEWLKENKPDEELVFSHGDYCLPNIFIKDNNVNGFIDLGRSGVADKYQDIALCYRSLQHNYNGSYGGKIYEDFNPELLFNELGILPDWDKIKYYILMDELF
ncbi:APH(3') family aminoglycoside O-phosphotransferase [Anaerocolumna xylanovorans]|uniref:Kanamycin kinase n=1 Tax=Anaerocolumna xylanovorans DSM 12503 TaxID=1121345 RepID=A0A1M7YNK5_9FIRM|nr:APH(3') family aminoglycoside O-phosphotransferase [Anaerocolumna xylanovorans]SHO54086.1 kanamycin kinase [Anaerocolumna xylanovorans DSM 12503]